MKLFRKLSIFGATLCLAGSVGIVLSIYYSTYYESVSNRSSTVNAAALPAKYTAEPISDIPVKIIVGNLNINLQVIEGNYDSTTKEWTLSDDSAQYATITRPVNNQYGGTLIYGHNTSQVFKSLHNIRKGDKATVITKNGYQFTYKFDSSEAFDPNDSSALAYDGNPRLFLQTCSGVWSQHRQMFYFDLIQYSKLDSSDASVRGILESLPAQSISPSGGSPSLNILLESS